jgi:hypothetical protein
MATLPTENAPTPQPQPQADRPRANLPPVAGLQVTGEQHANVEPQPAFYLIWHRRRWLVKCGEVIPDFGKIYLLSGCNGVDENRAGEPVMTDAIADATNGGWTKLEWTVLPWEYNGKHVPAYIHELQGGWYMFSEKLFPGGTKSETDDEAYVAWSRALVDRGIVAEPPISVLNKLVKTFVTARNRLRTKKPDEAEGLDAKIVVVRDYIKKLRGATKGKPIKAGAGLPSVGGVDASA